MKQSVQFGSKIGLIAATVGSAVGLGNVWRFPAETQANGGAAFLLIYIACVFLLGIPVMLSEFALGRRGRSDAVGAFKNITPGNRWWLTGGTGILASYMILCFYMVVAGWTLEYLWQSITNQLYTPLPGVGDMESIAGADMQFTERMEQYIKDPWRPLVFTLVMIAINFAVLVGGVRKGIERISNILMPVLFLLLVIFCGVALTLPRAADGLAFFLNPDFSKVTASTVIDALGQAFFSLSLGMGILITYSSYFPRDTRLTRTAVTVSVLDLLVAVLMGIIIFPAVVSFGLDDANLQGATLIFVTLPEVFMQMPGTQLWSILFFLSLMVAALTSTISIAEVSVAFFHDRFGMSRFKACLAVLLPLTVFSSVCSLSQGVLSDVTVAGLDIFSLLDTVATNVMLPVCAFFTCIYMGWVAPRGMFVSELTNDGTLRSRFAPIVLFIVKWIAPVLILIILFSPLL